MNCLCVCAKLGKETKVRTYIVMGRQKFEAVHGSIHSAPPVHVRELVRRRGVGGGCVAYSARV